MTSLETAEYILLASFTKEKFSTSGGGRHTVQFSMGLDRLGVFDVSKEQMIVLLVCKLPSSPRKAISSGHAKIVLPSK